MIKYIIKRIANYIVMLFVAITMTYFLASAFMDPRSNYMSRHPHPPIASINRALDNANINDQTPVCCAIGVGWLVLLPDGIGVKRQTSRMWARLLCRAWAHPCSWLL